MREALPVTIKKTDIEQDYPYLTHELAKKLNKNPNFIAKMIAKLGLKGNSDYHQSIRSSKSTIVNRYSDSLLSYLENYLKGQPDYNPYK